MFMDLITLVCGFGAPWLLGACLLLVANGAPAAGRAAWAVGCGWFVGLFLLTLWMRALSLAGVPYGVASIGLPIGLAAMATLALALRRNPQWRASVHASLRACAGADLHGAMRVLWFALLAWLALRFALLLAEVILRPLYPWDAWEQWATKARVWFAMRRMVPFISELQWLTSQGQAGYLDAAPHYPATVPLAMTWSALLIGRWDEALVNVPWWFCGIAFGVAVYGALVQRAFSPLAALVGTWLVLSLPIVNVHIALAGYADLWMAAYFTLATLAALRWVETRRWSDATLAIILVIACLTIKNPGRIWALMLLPGLIVGLMPRWGLRIVAGGFAIAALAVVFMAKANIFILGYRLQINASMPWAALSDAYLMFGNWNLLWYGVIATALVARREILSRELAPLTVIVAGGAIFLLFGFAFTFAAAWVEDQSTVNRATLHLAPLLTIWVMMACRAWVNRGARTIATSPAVPSRS